jgi:hypothetical protein
MVQEPMARDRGPPRYCSTDRRLCAALRREGRAGQSTLNVSEGAAAARAVATLPAGIGETYYRLYPIIVREAGGAWLIGVDRGHYFHNSGGRFSSRTLFLFRLEPGAAAARQLLEVPMSGSALVRLCPGRRDEVPNCWQDYWLESAFFPDLDNPAGPPRFILSTRAEIYPGLHAAAPGTAAPLLPRHEPDPVCTFRRVFSFDSAAGRYVADAPLPACEKYFRMPD